MTIKVTTPDERHDIDMVVDSDTTIAKLKEVIAARINHEIAPWLPELKKLIKNGVKVHVQLI